MKILFVLYINVYIMLSRNANSLFRSSGISAFSKLRIKNTPFQLRMVSTDTTDVEYMKGTLNNLISSTARGTNDNNKQEILGMVESFAAANAQKSSYFSPQDLLGDWELLYTDDDITRSSPFFWAFRKALRDIEDPLKIVGPKMLSDSIFKITDSLPFKSIGRAMQSFAVNDDLMEGESMRGTLKSSMEIKVAVAGSSLMTTTSNWRSTDEPDLIEIEVEKTEVLESPLSSIINFLPPVFKDNLSAFPSGAALELVKPGSSTVYMRLIYLDNSMRIIKNEADGKTFIYGRSF